MPTMNPVIETLVNRKSIRKYKPEQPSQKTLEWVVKAGQQAPFASQLCSLLLKRDGGANPFHAPWLFTVCVDVHKWEIIMKRRGWAMSECDLTLMVLGMQDAALMAENMVVAGESLGLGSCFLGEAPFRAEKIIEEYSLPPRVFPMVQLVMGYPAEDPPPRPRYPMHFVLFEGAYPEFAEEQVSRAMQVMDEGYIAQGYYKDFKAKIPLRGDREETFGYDNYGWTEHICRKWGQKFFPQNMLEQFEKCGFDLAQQITGESAGK